MKNMNFMYLMDMIDDKYIVEAKMLPRPKREFGATSRLTSFFSDAMTVAATIIVFGALIICSLVGKDLLTKDQGCDTTPTDAVTTPIITTEPDVYSEGLDIKSTYDNKGYVVSGIGTCTDTEIVIPLEYMGLPIVEIGSKAFYKCTNITSVTISNNVTEIGKSAFYGCEALQKITIPSKLNVLSESVFSGCKSLKNITIPNGVTEIGANAFSSCSELTSITIPDSVTYIGKGAFYKCTKIVSMTLPFVGEKKDRSGYTNFGYIFGTSSGNSQVPKSLINVVITGGNILDDNAFNGCSGIRSITLPNSLLFIGHYVFQNCTNLERIVIPKSVTYIGSRVFVNCPKSTIYCKANKQPAEWDASWNYENRPILWGYTGDKS